MYVRGIFEVSGLMRIEGNTHDRDNSADKLVQCHLKYGAEIDISKENNWGLFLLGY